MKIMQKHLNVVRFSLAVLFSSLTAKREQVPLHKDDLSYPLPTIHPQPAPDHPFQGTRERCYIIIFAFSSR